MEYKLVGGPYMHELYCDEAGQIYHYLASGKREYLVYNQSVRTVSEMELGKDTSYTSVKVIYNDGSYCPALDVADLVARSAFGIGNSIYGYTRLKRKDIRNLHIKNLEFIERDPQTGEILSLTDNTGTTRFSDGGMASLDKQVYWDELPGAQAIIDYVDKVREGRKKLDLGDRDRSVVAELLYSLIAEKEMSAADALKTLAIPGGYDTLELYLEGKDIVEERVVSDMKARYKRDQERAENHPLVRAQRELLVQGGQPGYRDKGTDPIEPN